MPNKPKPRSLSTEPLEERLPVSGSIAGVLFGYGLANDIPFAQQTVHYESPALQPALDIFELAPLDLQLDAMAVDLVHAEESLDTIASEADDPFTLTPLTPGDALSDTTSNAHRELGNELLLKQMASSNFQSPGRIDIIIAPTFGGGIADGPITETEWFQQPSSNLSLAGSRSSFEDDDMEIVMQTSSSTSSGGFQLMVLPYYTDVKDDPAYQGTGLMGNHHYSTDEVYNWVEPANGQRVFWKGTYPSWVIPTSIIGTFTGLAAVSYYRDGTHDNSCDNGWNFVVPLVSLRGDGHSASIRAFPDTPGYYDIKVHNAITKETVVIYDVYYCDITSIEWVTRAASPNTNGYNLGKLDLNNGQYRIFPEQPDPNTVNCNVAELKVTITPAIANGATGTLYVDVFDPANQQLLNSGLSGVGEPDDNYGGLGVTLSSNTLTFENGQSVNSVYLTVTSAHAGNNWIVGISPIQSIIDEWTQVSKSGSKNTLELKPVEKRVYTPGVLRQSQMLTVWRTLWVELDQMYVPSGFQSDGKTPNEYQPGVDQLAMDFPSGILASGGIIATQLARACIVPTPFTPNSKVEVPGEPGKTILSGADEDSIRERLKAPAYRDSPAPQEDFWTVHVVNAFRRNSIDKKTGAIKEDSPVGNHHKNLIIIHEGSIVKRLEGENLSHQYNTIYSLILLHEIGHALWLDHPLGDDENPVSGVTYGVMLNKDPLGLHLVADNDKFTLQNLKDIQAMGVPEAGSGWNRPK